jgi:CspA family cold shock protein
MVAEHKEGRETGLVKKFSLESGYGFILPETGGDDVFVGATALQESGLDDLKHGMYVSFRRIEIAGRYRAVEIKVEKKRPIVKSPFQLHHQGRASGQETTPHPNKWHKGKIKWYDPAKRFGFVIVPGVGTEVFLSRRVMGRPGLDVNLRYHDLIVEVKIGNGRKPGQLQVDAIRLK